MEIETWEDLAHLINQMTEEQKKQPVQVVLHSANEGDVLECMPGIAIDSVRNFKFYRCRSTHNNKYCPDDIVLLVDHNFYAEDGVIAYEWKTAENGSHLDIPIYGKDGPIKLEDQTAPNKEELREKWDKCDMPNHIMNTVNYRMKDIDEILD